MRKILAVITAMFVALGMLLVASPAMAKDKHDDHDGHGNDHKTVTMCVNDVTKEVKKDDVKKYLHHGATLGACVVVPPVDPTVPQAAPEGPGPYLQAYGLVEDPTCQLTVEWAKWEGVPDGGWTQSWGEWLNDGEGGMVCSRTVELVNGEWTVY